MPIGGSLTNIPGGFTSGISLRGIPLVQTQPGNVFWVNNSATLNAQARAGSNSNRGTYLAPFATLQKGIDSCVAGRGDIIFVSAGHAESVSSASAITLNKSGVAIIGLGTGALRPTFTFDTANTSTIGLAASNVSISNCLFLAGFLNVATVFNVANAQVATDFSLEQCAFRDNSTILNFVKIITIGTTANICDGLYVNGCRVFGQAAAPAAGTTMISTGSIINRMILTNNWITHQVLLNSTACLIASGALDLTSCKLGGNITDRPNTTSTGELWSTSSIASNGTMLCDNYCGTLSANGLIAPVGTKAQFIQNFCMLIGAQDKSAALNPVAV